MRSQLLAAAGVVAALTLLSRVLGFLRETVLAAVFGASYTTDAFLVASVLPVTLAVMVGGAVTTALIPVYTQFTAGAHEANAGRLAGSVMAWVVLGLGGLSLLVEFFAPFLVQGLAPGFPPDVFREAVRLTRLMLPALVLTGMAAVLTGLLQAHMRFVLPALVSATSNLVLILAIVLLGRTYGVAAAAYGTVLGALAQVLVQWPGLRGLGLRLRLTLNVTDPAVRRVGWLLLPILLGSAAHNVNLVVERMLASGLPEGSIAALNFANRLASLPGSLVVTPLTTVFFPALARLVGAGEMGRFRENLAEGARLLNFAVMPLAVGVMVLAEPLVRLLFERGAFDVHDTQMTAFALVFYGLGLVGVAQADLANRAFFARQDTRTPVRVAVLAVLLNVVLNLLLVGPMKHGGLALGTSVAMNFMALALYWSLRRQVGPLGGRALLVSGAKAVAAALVMALVVRAAYGWVEGAVPGAGIMAQTVRLGVAAGAGAVVYPLAAQALGMPEVGMVLGLVGKAVRRLRRGPPREAAEG